MSIAPISPLFRPCAALIALAVAVPLAAQDDFSLPQPTPTPSPAPAGPADERAGVVIPPRATSTPPPRIDPAPVLSDEATARPAEPRAPQPTARPTTRPVAPPAAPSAATPAPAAAATPALPAPAAGPALPAPLPSATPLALPSPEGPPDAPPSSALGAPVVDWRWLAAGAALLASLIGAVLVFRQRKPKALRLAAPPATSARDEPPALPRIDLALEILGATRSVMTFTLRYRLALANRSNRAINDLAVAVQLASAQRGASNAPSVAAAQGVSKVERIGPHQSRSISGEVQLPLSAIVPVMQGATPLFIPLLHITLEGEGQPGLTRSFVIGTSGSGSDGRVQPLLLTTPPGGLPPLKARAIDPPPAA